jgi:aldose 1-epimerase
MKTSNHLKSILTVIALASCCFIKAQGITLSGLDPSRFNAVIDGKSTALYVLTNDKGNEACITNYGARLVSLMEPNWNGRMEDMVLGYDNVMDYHTKGQNFGATVGRYIGRIVGPRMTIDGKTYKLQENGKGVISHGGRPGFADRVWDVVSYSRQKLVLRYVSPDGENGFPGELTTTLTYALRDDGALGIDFKAVTTKPTVVNLANHSFFNISGNPERSVETQCLWIDSKKIAAYDKNKNVTGEFLDVRQTPFDFHKPHQIGERINEDNAQLKVTGGYDHAFSLSHGGDLSRPAAILYDAQSGRALTVYTTEPAIQVYTGNGLKGSQVGKKGVVYKKRCAICLETLHYADSPNRPQFPSTLLRPGQTYHSHTVFVFSTDPPLIMKSEKKD